MRLQRFSFAMVATMTTLSMAIFACHSAKKTAEIRVPELVDESEMSRQPASMIKKPALEDPTGKDLSGYSTLESCDLLNPDWKLKKDNKGKPLYAQCTDDPFYKSARAGQEIWLKATGGNQRFHQYNYQQRLGVYIDWYKVLNTEERYTNRFGKWGMVNDPDCCNPAIRGDCKKKVGRDIRVETYGFDYCPGDEVLLASVGGKTEYKDPACRFLDSKDKSVKQYKLAQSSCDLEFGTSTGIVGLRKFPNPKFDPDEWIRIGGYKGYSEKKLFQDHSIEPPFRVGQACGACHIGFKPGSMPNLKGQKITLVLNSPEWENLAPAIGASFSKVSQLMASGMDKNSLEWQMFTKARPGTVDTSAVSNDSVNNPGTMNAIFNVDQRPRFQHTVKGTFHRAMGPKGQYAGSELMDDIYHILKDGSDSVGAAGAVQRVYFNIGTCSEECWTNHLTDMFQLESSQRHYAQTPLNIRQCQQDCRAYRAIEARVFDVFNFFRSVRPNDLKDIKTVNVGGDSTYPTLTQKIESNAGVFEGLGYTPGAVKRGEVLFAKNCASCHSSQTIDPKRSKDGGHYSEYLYQADAKDIHPEKFFTQSAQPFYQTIDGKGEATLRRDFLSNEKLVDVKDIKTFKCRAQHSNHMKNHVWEYYGSETYFDRKMAGVEQLKEYPLGRGPGMPREAVKTYYGQDKYGNGPGFYRNTSLINVWAHAPFMHNNAIGPELKGQVESGDDFYVNTYENPSDSQAIEGFLNPTVRNRVQVYSQSVRQLLTPEQRRPKKVSRVKGRIEIPITPHVGEASQLISIPSIKLAIPDGTEVTALVSFRHKDFIKDLYDKLKHRDLSALPKAQRDAVELAYSALQKPNQDGVQLIELNKSKVLEILEAYSNCVPVDEHNNTDYAENLGHPMGTGLSSEEKLDLEAFMLTL